MNDSALMLISDEQIDWILDKGAGSREAGRLALLSILIHFREQQREADAQWLNGILAEYSEELEKGACDRCNDCSLIMMCRFHSLLSMLTKHTESAAAIRHGTGEK
jgi:hypothetical protein